MAQQNPDESGRDIREIADTTPLHRQLVHNWIRNGRVTSQGFKPTRKDNNVLSLAHGDVVSPAESQQRHRARGYQSDAVATLTGADCRQVELRPIHDGDPTPEHVSMPYPPDASNSQRNDVARRLAARAILTVPPASRNPSI